MDADTLAAMIPPDLRREIQAQRDALNQRVASAAVDLALVQHRAAQRQGGCPNCGSTDYDTNAAGFIDSRYCPSCGHGVLAPERNGVDLLAQRAADEPEVFERLYPAARVLAVNGQPIHPSGRTPTR